MMGLMSTRPQSATFPNNCPCSQGYLCNNICSSQPLTKYIPSHQKVSGQLVDQGLYKEGKGSLPLQTTETASVGCFVLVTNCPLEVEEGTALFLLANPAAALGFQNRFLNSQVMVRITWLPPAGCFCAAGRMMLPLREPAALDPGPFWLRPSTTSSPL